jgi:hypothetical protein
METKRPTLNDKEEYAIIKSIYFKDKPFNEDLDSIERNDRMESRFRNNRKSSR